MEAVDGLKKQNVVQSDGEWQVLLGRRAAVRWALCSGTAGQLALDLFPSFNVNVNLVLVHHPLSGVPRGGEFTELTTRFQIRLGCR